MKAKIGDIVQIEQYNPNKHNQDSTPYVGSPMETLFGTSGTIVQIRALPGNPNKEMYQIKGWWFSEDWIKTCIPGSDNLETRIIHKIKQLDDLWQQKQKDKLCA